MKLSRKKSHREIYGSRMTEHIHIVIQEIKEEVWGFSGMLIDDWKRSPSEASRRQSD